MSLLGRQREQKHNRLFAQSILPSEEHRRPSYLESQAGFLQSRDGGLYARHRNDHGAEVAARPTNSMG